MDEEEHTAQQEHAEAVAFNNAAGHLRRMQRMQILSDLWVWLGIACICAMLGYWFDPSYSKQSVIHRVAEPWTGVWVHGFGLAGVLLLSGIFTRRIALEASGLIILATALTINWVAVLLVTPGSTGTVILPALIITALARFYVIFEKAKWARTLPPPPERLIDGTR